ncbi:uncharacterized protein CCOS01_02078 [Colletotrichum costaricense]|uniref:Uncharacterized protein n=1 Tax=Colletotrichum costaricense TaxID=1209916 RepID=A0AAI9Z6S5_9PEZI|nr:uncharacterized protein CCOS01_02078 [Colletotrichum costaricense]KAK1536758.1 hypothetical protein CCOS01_02078 [Colletotrichum costaricense]
MSSAKKPETVPEATPDDIINPKEFVGTYFRPENPDSRKEENQYKVEIWELRSQKDSHGNTEPVLGMRYTQIKGGSEGIVKDPIRIGRLARFSTLIGEGGRFWARSGLMEVDLGAEGKQSGPSGIPVYTEEGHKVDFAFNKVDALWEMKWTNDFDHEGLVVLRRKQDK